MRKSSFNLVIEILFFSSFRKSGEQERTIYYDCFNLVIEILFFSS